MTSALRPSVSTALPADRTEDFDREAADPHCMSGAESDALLRGAPWQRLAVVGDSLAEGLGIRCPATAPRAGPTGSPKHCAGRYPIGLTSTSVGAD